MSDPRLSWLVSSPLAGLIASAGGGNASSVGLDPAVQAWLSQSTIKLLSAYTIKGSKGIKFTNEVGALAQVQDTVDQELHMIKLDSANVNGEEIDFAKQVLVTNTVGDAVQGLYQLIHSVFAPKLLGGSDSALASKLQPDMVSLESKLHKLSLISSGAAGGPAGRRGSGPPPRR